MRGFLGAALGSLLLTAATLPAEASEPVRLADADLDSVTAGSAIIGLIMSGNSTAGGSLYSISNLLGSVQASGNDDLLFGTGYAISYGFSFGNGASASANTDGSAFGDVAYTATAPISGGNNWWRFAASATVGAAGSVP